MRSLQDYINTISNNSPKIVKEFGVKTLRIFGSVSRNEQTENSDLDVCVETETANPFLLADLKEFLEDLFKCSVDVIRIHKNMNQLLRQRIEKKREICNTIKIINKALGDTPKAYILSYSDQFYIEDEGTASRNSWLIKLTISLFCWNIKFPSIPYMHLLHSNNPTIY